MKARTNTKEIVLLISAILIALALSVLFILFIRHREQLKRAQAATVTEVMSENASANVNTESVPVSNDREQETTYREIESVTDFADEKWSEGLVRHDGKIYRYRSGLQNYLFLGIDNDDPVAPAADGISGGQSDAIFLLVTDRVQQQVSIIAINRNTIVPVDVYDEAGDFVVQMDLQICLQHGYGDGMKLSCIRSVEAVNRLFKGVPVSGYISLNMGGLPAVNDAIGGVELTPVESVRRGDIVITKGKPITLSGEQAYAYLRTRDVDAFGSANDRLQRQQQYIVAAIGKLLADPGKANKIYEAGGDYIVASIDLPKLIDSTKDMTFTEDHMYQLPGETEFKDDFERYNVDEEGMIRLILDVFYEEVQ